MNESVFAVNVLETGGIGLSAKRWGAPSCPLTWHHLHFTVSIQ